MNNPTAEAIARAWRNQFISERTHTYRSECNYETARARAEGDANEFEAAFMKATERLDASRAEQAGGDRLSTHHVHRGSESLPCYCSADMDHAIGQERKPEDGEAQQYIHKCNLHGEFMPGCGQCAEGLPEKNLRAQHPQRPDGGEWKWVPVRSTNDMNAAGFSTILEKGKRAIPEIYEAMLATTPAPPAVGEGDVYEAYKTWPEDIRKKLSLHDLRRMSGWAPKTNVGDWRIDTSAGGPILTYQNCSVIEGEQARLVLSLIANTAPPSREVGDAAKHIKALQGMIRGSYPEGTPGSQHAALQAAIESLSAAPRQVGGEASLWRIQVGTLPHYYTTDKALAESEAARSTDEYPISVTPFAQPAPVAVDEAPIAWMLEATVKNVITRDVWFDEPTSDYIRSAYKITPLFMGQQKISAVDDEMVSRAFRAYHTAPTYLDSDYSKMRRAIVAALTPDAIRPGG